jgi:hypothetical protein
MADIFELGAKQTTTDGTNDFVLQTGYCAPEELQLCSINAMAKYPYNFIGDTNREKVSSSSSIGHSSSHS